MTEDVLRQVLDTHEEAVAVHQRREHMLKSLQQRKLLTPELRDKLLRMVHLSQLEDAWEPFKERKTSLASRGREAGLGPLATQILTQPDPVSSLRETLRKVKDGEKLLLAILAEEVQRQEGLREILLDYTRQTGSLRCELVEKARKKNAKEMKQHDFEQLRKHFSYYDNKTWPVRYVSSHIILAMHRGESKGVLQVKFSVGEGVHGIFMRETLSAFPGIARRVRDTGRTYSNYELDLLSDALRMAEEHFLKASQNTVRRDLKKGADKEAIQVFSHNARQLLLQRPLTQARILAMDPGLTHGVKCVALDEKGDVLTFFRCTLLEEDRMKAYIVKIVETKQLNKIVIGNGTASRETAKLVSYVIKDRGWKDVEFAVVSEAGASVYSVSDIAKEEFPHLDLLYRGAVSIGRRVLDPLSELVKIPVRSMGIGMYQHDVDEKELLKELQHTVQSCVAQVGVNGSSGSKYVMAKVPGITKAVVEQVVLTRHARQLHSREDLRRVPGMSSTVFTQIAGFFRFPNSSEPLDNTNVHPESYPIVRQLLSLYEAEEPQDVPARRVKVGKKIAAMTPDELQKLSDTLNCGVVTLQQVGRELVSPALDPRASLPHAGLLRKETREAAHLREGDTLDGMVMSVTTFGVFVDCGLHENVLIHGRAATECLQVGSLVKNIKFLRLDHLGRPQVQWTPPTPQEHTQQTQKGLLLESQEYLTGGSLSASLAQVREERQQWRGPRQQTDSDSKAVLFLKRSREGSEVSSENNDEGDVTAVKKVKPEAVEDIMKEFFSKNNTKQEKEKEKEEEETTVVSEAITDDNDNDNVEKIVEQTTTKKAKPAPAPKKKVVKVAAKKITPKPTKRKLSQRNLKRRWKEPLCIFN
ncbi:Tex-like protein N-terminal domain/Tex protein YqgF-like domain/Helix-hairpin-helix motif/HHH domain containing protein, putative [Angomonas deanei]|uniref:Tex-like protein N-terminal domain/Tex protein YqgF-like domain/Helix-hairpin-helix motif/HHH domain containing protein, putative n=1 Tax=Angomonas deanei TaxID=59799 RepID=A0A7G2CV52_9TRYP|nr:Tex-like protein N-terminal domain/Tex protein YqgF-like domain/Helix-hairpin-helix motif/HHH domain containing protein, putative [Angomonas deanei]